MLDTQFSTHLIENKLEIQISQSLKAYKQILNHHHQVHQVS